MRKTKIVATLGPATDAPGMMDKMFEAGADVFRMNYSHGTHDDHANRCKVARELSLKHHRAVAVLADLQGPKIRVEQFAEGSVIVEEGQAFSFDTSLGRTDGNDKEVGVSYEKLPTDVKPGNVLLIDDGKLEMEVTSVEGTRVNCKVLVGGKLSNSKGINLKGGGLSAAALTDKDIEDLEHAVSMGVDFIAVSFVRVADDVDYARSLVKKLGSHARIVSKIERAEALEGNNLEEIIEASDAIMVARGDLGVEIGFAAVPPAQKKMIKLARAKDKAVITATQMMESMIEAPMPTRAEVSDVANAVLDGTDAVMLSAETSVGKYPDITVKSMASVCSLVEGQGNSTKFDKRLSKQFGHVDEAIAMATMYTATHTGVKAIASLTETGSTALWMSRVISDIPIFALSRHAETRRRVALYRGVYPVSFDITHTDPLQANKEVIEKMLERKIVKDGDYVIITKGDLSGERGGTNNMKLLKVGDNIEQTL